MATRRTRTKDRAHPIAERLGFTGQDDSGDALQIFDHTNSCPAAEQLFYTSHDGPTHLHDQKSARFESPVCLRDEAGDDFQSCRAGEDRATRLELANFKLDLIFFRFADVGRVGDDQIKSAGIESLEQIALAKTNAAIEPVTSGVSVGDLESRWGNVSRVNLSLREFLGKSEGNAAGAGADVHNAGLLDRTNQGQYGLDDVLGLGAGNEHGGRNDKVHAPEFLMAGDVLRGNSAGASADCFLIAVFFEASEFALGVCKEIGAVAAQDEHKQQFSVQSRRAYPGRSKGRNRRVESFFKEHEIISTQKS